MQLGRQPTLEPDHAGALTWTYIFQNYEKWVYIIYKLLILWYFFRAAQGKIQPLSTDAKETMSKMDLIFLHKKLTYYLEVKLEKQARAVLFWGNNVAEMGKNVWPNDEKSRRWMDYEKFNWGKQKLNWNFTDNFWNFVWGGRPNQCWKCQESMKFKSHFTLEKSYNEEYVFLVD